MRAGDIVRAALAALAAHRLRAALSSIGIVAGVAAVVAAFAIGEGARREAFEDIGSLGVTNIFVRATGADVPNGPRRKAPAPSLTLADARAIASAIPSSVAVAASRSTRTRAAAAATSADVMLAGVTANWRQVAEPRISAGRWLMNQDVTERRRVAVIGNVTARALFGNVNAIGARVNAGGDWYVVVGVVGDRPITSATRTPIQRLDVSRSILVPISAMDVALGDGDALDRVDEIAVRAPLADEVESTVRQTAAVLRRRQGTPARYEIVVPRELLRARLRAQRTFNAVLLGIGALALFISGIGIMNIMLASVVERTPEIGVRRAFGARRRDVIAQFAAESALLCLAGGAAGVPAGAAIAGIVALFAGWPVALSSLGVVLALLLSTSVGLAFGVYPARRAARVDPIEALRAT